MKNKRMLLTLFSLLLFSCFPSNSTAEEYTNDLIIPPILDYTMQNNTKVFTLTTQNQTHQFDKNISAKTFSYGDMTYLGPTIRVNDKDNVEIVVKNQLKEATTLHQHGLHLPAEADGNVFQVIDSKKSWTSKYAVSQVAGTFWYHPHRDERTGYQVAQGLAGFLIVDDKESDALPLPKTYGVDDIPLAIQDKKITRNKIVYTTNMRNSIMGNISSTLITNGTIAPKFTATRSLLRFRLLNASTFAIHKYFFNDNRTFYLIANDGGLLDKPYPLKSIILAPAERREILIDISDLSPQETLDFMTEIHGSVSKIALKIKADKFVESNTVVPTSLVSLQKLVAKPTYRTRSFVMQSQGGMGSMMRGNSGLTINGTSMDMRVVNERVPINTTEVWTISNPSQGGMMQNIPHTFHPHHGSFQILSINGNPPPPNQTGWKDNVLLLPGDTVSIIMEFSDYLGKFMYHCHLLEHEDAGMMGVFEVVER